MNPPFELNQYKQEIADLYSRRSQTYDQGDWHPRIAQRLIDYAKIKPGQKVLDIACGTGMVAISVAELIGVDAQVVGVDISTGMLDEAKRKAEVLGLKNIQFQLADAEALDFPPNSFDVILCSSALIWMSNVSAALCHWQKLLKSGGLIGFHAFSETAFVGGVVVQNIVEKYGISLAFSKPTGTVEKCRNLLQEAGFDSIEIYPEPDGNYITLEQAQGMWTGGSHPAPGQFPNPLSQLSDLELEQVKVEFDAQLARLVTDRLNN